MTETCENCGHLKEQHDKVGCIYNQENPPFYCPCKKFKAKKVFGMDVKIDKSLKDGEFRLEKPKKLNIAIYSYEGSFCSKCNPKFQNFIRRLKEDVQEECSGITRLRMLQKINKLAGVELSK